MDNVKNLRTITGKGFLECKNALCKYNGDLERAKAYLKYSVYCPHTDIWHRRIWASDFYDRKRLNNKGLYRFSVKGDSAEYIKNKYNLDYDNVFVAVFATGTEGTCGSFNNDKSRSDVTELDCNDSTDIYRQIRVELLVEEEVTNE